MVREGGGGQMSDEDIAAENGDQLPGVPRNQWGREPIIAQGHVEEFLGVEGIGVVILGSGLISVEGDRHRRTVVGLNTGTGKTVQRVGRGGILPGDLPLLSQGQMLDEYGLTDTVDTFSGAENEAGDYPVLDRRLKK